MNPVEAYAISAGERRAACGSSEIFLFLLHEYQYLLR
jgi:hypothetical protein